jgi:hypothetical protein
MWMIGTANPMIGKVFPTRTRVSSTAFRATRQKY